MFHAAWTFVAIFCLENPPQKSCLKRSNCKRNASRTLVAATKLLFDHQSSFCPFELKNWTTRAAIYSETCAVFGNFDDLHELQICKRKRKNNAQIVKSNGNSTLFKHYLKFPLKFVKKIRQNWKHRFQWFLARKFKTNLVKL